MASLHRSHNSLHFIPSVHGLTQTLSPHFINLGLCRTAQLQFLSNKISDTICSMMPLQHEHHSEHPSGMLCCGSMSIIRQYLLGFFTSALLNSFKTLSTYSTPPHSGHESKCQCIKICNCGQLFELFFLH
jgi:hypothetical protein